MVIYNAATRELTAKIVYYGPGLCGKTTNLKVLHDRLEPGTAGKLLTDEQGLNVSRAMRMPIAVSGSNPAPIEHRHFVLDRLRFEETVLALYKGGPIQAFEAEA